MKKISVVITNYNYNQYLDKCIESVISQSYPDIEVIVVDDASDEKPPGFSQSSAGRIKYYCLTENCGLAAAANLGFKNATGQYFMRLDADDWLEPGCLAAMIAEMGGVNAVFSDYWACDKGTRFLVQQKDSPPHGSCMLIKSSTFKKFGGYNESLDRQEDYEFYLRLMKHGSIKYLPVPLWNYRKHHGQMSNAFNDRIQQRQVLKGTEAPKVLTVVPARIGSKGVPRKNLYKIDGVTLVARAVRMIKESNIDTMIIVSTDSKDIAAVADEEGVDAIQRPSILANDYVSTIPVAQHAHDFMKSNEWDADIVISVQPTCPYTPPSALYAGYNKLIDLNLDSVVSMAEWTGSHPYRAFVPENANSWEHNGPMRPMFPELSEQGLQRQDRPTCYRFTGGFYIRRKELLIDWNGTDYALGDNWRPQVVSETAGIDIDGYLDLWLAEAVKSKCAV